jgi:hypothetical protein
MSVLGEASFEPSSSSIADPTVAAAPDALDPDRVQAYLLLEKREAHPDRLAIRPPADRPEVRPITSWLGFAWAVGKALVSIGRRAR